MIEVHFTTVISPYDFEFQKVLKNIIPDYELAVLDKIPYVAPKCEFISARLLARQVIASKLRIPMKSVQLIVGDSGGLTIKDSDYSISISHTRNIAVVGLSNSGPLGIDFEDSMQLSGQSSWYRTVLRLAGQLEKALRSGVESEMVYLALKVWCLCEAKAKYSGLDLYSVLKTSKHWLSLHESPEDIWVRTESGSFLTTQSVKPYCQLAVFSETSENISCVEHDWLPVLKREAGNLPEYIFRPKRIAFSLKNFLERGHNKVCF